MVSGRLEICHQHHMMYHGIEFFSFSLIASIIFNQQQSPPSFPIVVPFSIKKKKKEKLILIVMWIQEKGTAHELLFNSLCLRPLRYTLPDMTCVLVMKWPRLLVQFLHRWNSANHTTWIIVFSRIAWGGREMDVECYTWWNTHYVTYYFGMRWLAHDAYILYLVTSVSLQLHHMSALHYLYNQSTLAHPMCS